MPSFKGRRWKLLGLSVVATFVLAASIYAYWRINAPSPSTLCVTDTLPPLELRMELDKTEFQLNETVAIHISLKNIGDGPITIFTPNYQQFVGFIVKDINNTVVLDFPYSGLPTIDEATLESGGQINKTFNWSQTGLYPDGSGGVVERSVPHGIYHIIGRTGEHLTYDLEAEEWIDIKTPSITVTITPPPRVTATYPPLELSMNLSKTAYQQNETIAVSLFLTNKGSETVEIIFPQEWVWDHVLRFIVKDENDTTVYLHPTLMYFAVYELVLEPGEQRIETYEWNQTYNLGPYYEQPFKLGTYKIIGQTMNYGIPGKNLPKGHRLGTPPITLTIG